VLTTCRFGVRLHSNGGSASRFEVLDRATGAAVATGMVRVEVGREARRRNHDRSGPAAMTMRLGRAEVAALQVALDVYMAFQIAGQDRPILEDLYVLFTSWQAGDG
jgi:hypothetical protein